MPNPKPATESADDVRKYPCIDCWADSQAYELEDEIVAMMLAFAAQVEERERERCCEALCWRCREGKAVLVTIVGHVSEGIPIPGQTFWAHGTEPCQAAAIRSRSQK